MISYEDEAYIATKALLLEKRELRPPLSDFAEWIAREFGVTRPINIRLNVVEPLRERARLQVIFRDAASARYFRTSNSREFDDEKVQHVIDNFRHIAAGSRLDADVKHAMIATFRQFEAPARWEANAAIPDDQNERLQQVLSPLGIWKIYPLFSNVTFFFDTDDQLRQSLENGSRAKCEELYAKALKPYDRFGYFEAKPIMAKYDSRETFERDYDGNWFTYTR